MAAMHHAHALQPNTTARAPLHGRALRALLAPAQACRWLHNNVKRACDLGGMIREIMLVPLPRALSSALISRFTFHTSICVRAR